QICDSEFYDGWWLPETNQILYIVNNGEKTQLNLLDIATWQTQLLWEIGGLSNPLSVRSHIVGWTPLEFDDSSE
ncbi:MAG: hypothetical protein AAF490_27510, partial [Chloroflexota bacterium]